MNDAALDRLAKAAADTVATAALDRLAKTAADTVATAAIRYVRQTAPAHDFDLDVLTPILRQSTKDAIGDALDAAQEALDAGLSGWASSAFAAPLAEAGIEAGRTYLESV
jgi:hypothetical protein